MEAPGTASTPNDEAMLRLYDSAVSGNCYKVRLLLAQLERPYERVEVDVIDRSNRPAEIRATSALEKIPTLRLEDGRLLCESNAILWFLAQGTPYLPEDELGRQRVLEWLFFEQNSHEPDIATAIFWVAIAKKPEQLGDALARMRDAGNAALAAMDRHLAKTPYLVAERYSIADVALYAYTHEAELGGFELDRYPAVGEWLARVREQPRHVPMFP